MTIIEETKELLSEPKFRIKLYDFIEENLSIATARTTTELFPMGSPWNPDELETRLEQYEEVTSDLISIMAILGFWGTSDHF